MTRIRFEPKKTQDLAPEHSLEQCANHLVDQLPPHIAAVVRESSYVASRVPLWVTVAGLVLRAFENGEVTYPILDPAWPRVFPEVAEYMRAHQSGCEHCGAEFDAKRYKQRFCSNECGTAAQLAGVS